MSLASWRATGVLAAAACLSVTAYLVAYRHSDYYFGTSPPTVNCVSCHVDAENGSVLDRILPVAYRSPSDLSVTPDGNRLVATLRDSGQLQVIDVPGRRPVSTIQVGKHPGSVILDRSGTRAYVANEWSDTVSIVDLVAGEVQGELPTGNLPSALALSADGETLFVANWQGDSISVINLKEGREKKRLSGGGSPAQIAVTPDGATLLVTNELSYLHSSREVPVSEVTIIDSARQVVTSRLTFENAHLLEGIKVLPPGDLAVLALVKPKNLLPVIHVARGWTMNAALGVIDLKTGQQVQLLLDEENASFADPFDVEVSVDGRWVFVTHSGVDCVTVVDVERLRGLLHEVTPENRREFAHRLDLSSRFVVKRIPTGYNPKGMAVSPRGDYLYVAETLADRILAVDLTTLEPAFTIDLGTTSRETVIRRGERLFNSASRTFQGQFSCRSCHPRNHEDRLQYDFEPDGLGRDVVDNRTLLGIRDTAPFKWNGKNTSLFMQCGIRFARILTRVDPFAPDELSALVAFIRSLRNPPNPNRLPDGRLTPSQARGKHFFERTKTNTGEEIPVGNRCITCHPPPLFTNRKSADVGSASPGDSQSQFDTPHLKNIFSSPPYLHDGKAATLEEIWIRFNPDDTHGITRDMSKKDLNDLIEYLKTL